jgi:hypothetical protein
MKRILGIAATMASGLVLAACAHGHPHQAAAPQPAAGQSVTVNIQGGPSEQNPWRDSPHMHAFYDLSVAAFANGPANVDVPAYEARAHVIFDAFARSMGADPAAMQEHLALIPRQVVQIAREDPSVLASYENFWRALVGPD